VASAVCALVLTGALGACGSTDGDDLGVDTSADAVQEAEPAEPVSAVDRGRSYVLTATATELDGAGPGGEVAVYAERGDEEPAQTISNPLDAEGTPVAPVVFLAEGFYDPDAAWVEVFLPVRPNGSTGWVRADDVTVAAHDFHIQVDLTEHRIEVTDGDEVVLEAPVGVGTSQTPTPGGVFYTRSLIRSTNPAYGPYAYGLSGYSEVHETFGSGPGDIGIHGTDDDAAVGTDVSNGCIRLRNEDIELLAEILPLGVPVEILA
jgi:lipoprotein-anchoring transpeptidase ErfK/SrfK